jgi:hypothetical protein
MKMPDKMDKSMFAPCGVDCNVCSGHLRTKNTCSGCLTDDKQKVKNCQQCAKRKCAEDRGYTYCYECKIFPCYKIRNLDNRYQQNYDSSLITNGNYVKQYGLDAFYERQKTLFTCKKCGGMIDVHHKKCSECGIIQE